MSPVVVVPQLSLRNVRKVLSAGVGACRVRVTVLGGVSLQLMPGDALAVTGPLPLARSMLCAIAAGAARCDSGAVRWGVRGVSGVRYAPAGDAPRALSRRDAFAPGVAVLDAALVEHAPAPDVRVLVELLAPWLRAGGAALVAAPVSARDWPWPIVELAGGALRPVSAGGAAERIPWAGGVRRVAEHTPHPMAPGRGAE
jgi:hypothetical protein